MVECNYKEVDRQLKEQFIHGLNDRVMLDEIVRELMAKNNSEQINSEDVLLWARQIETQRAQAAILNNITEVQKFDKVKLLEKPKGRQEAETTRCAYQRHPCKYCGEGHVPRQCPAYGKTCTRCRKIGHCQKVCMSKRNHAFHEVEVEVALEPSEEEIKTVSINSIYLNRNQSLITAHIKNTGWQTATEIQYKIDTGSEGNIMPLHIFKKLFKICQWNNLRALYKVT